MSPIDKDDPIKQVIVVRSDLKNIEGHKIRTGKLIAQCCHASISFLLRKVLHEFGWTGPVFSDVQEYWMENGQTKICVRVDSEEELHRIHFAAIQAGLESHKILDSGKTEFKEPTYTCLAIGPDYSSKIDKITGQLQLL